MSGQGEFVMHSPRPYFAHKLNANPDLRQLAGVL